MKQSKVLFLIILSVSLQTFIIRGQEEMKYIGEKQKGGWPFYDRKHPYMLQIKPSSNENLAKFESEGFALLEEFSIEGIKIKKLKFSTFYVSCPAIIYLFIENNKIYTIEYPDCGVDEEFHKTAREFLTKWVKEEL